MNVTNLNLVIGYPLTHSQTPLLHNTIYRILKINQLLLALSSSELKPLIQIIKNLSVRLTAVTMPFKEQVLEYLDGCSPEVEKLQTANTLLQRDGRLIGYNTDIDGIEFAFKNHCIPGKVVLVIGAGGAARSLGYFLKKHQTKIVWLNRTEKNAMTLANEFGGDIVTRETMSSCSPDIIVNTTPVGLFPNFSETPLPNYIFTQNQIVFDMVYNPRLTKLLSQAQEQQATIISGLDMFIGQGLKQIELLTGKNLVEPSFITTIKNDLIQNQIRPTQ